MSKLPHPAFGGTAKALVIEQLFLPGKDPVFAPFVIEGGQVLVQGAVLGIKTADSKLKLADPLSADGSEVPRFIIGENLDTTPGDKVFQVIVEGFVNEGFLTLGGTYTIDQVRAPLAQSGIYLKSARYSFDPLGA